MKIALFPGPLNGGIDQHFRPITALLTARGHTITTFHLNGPAPYPFTQLDDNFDLAHFGYYSYSPPFEGEELPKTMGVWAFWKIPYLDAMIRSMREMARLFVSESATLHGLGLHGLYNVTYAPLVFDPEPFHALPAPAAFTVGYFGNNYNPAGATGKRFHVIEQGADIARIPCRGSGHDPHRKEYPVDPVRDVYARISCLGHASFADTSSLPVQEALLCGRPVIAIRACGLTEIVRPGVNGYFFDGTPKDFARKLILVRDNYAALREGALVTPPPPVKEAADIYEQTWLAAIADASGASA